MDEYRKRFYTPRAFVRDLAHVLRHMPEVSRARRSGRVSHAFAEKVMLVVTQVNGCRYCAYAHTGMALRSGLNEEELAKLMALQIGDYPSEEAVALAFAQHYAESAGHPDPEAEAHFRDYYEPEASREIMNAIRMITLGNLAGNTVDAFLSRLRGHPARGSNAISEFVLFLLFAPATLPLLLVMRRKRRGPELGAA